MFCPARSLLGHGLTLRHRASPVSFERLASCEHHAAANRQTKIRPNQARITLAMRNSVHEDVILTRRLELPRRSACSTDQAGNEHQEKPG